MPLRLFTWNGRAGSGSTWWPNVAKGVDLVFLQEVRAPETDDAYFWRPVPGRRWGSALVARGATITTVPVRGYDGWVTGGRVERRRERRGAAPLFAFSVHVPSPSEKRPRKSYAREATIIAARLRRIAGRDATLILGGDFNIAMGRREKHDVVPMSAAEHRALDAIEAAPIRLTSLWQSCNRGTPLAQTLRWAKSPLTPYHCDGFFVPPALAEGAECSMLDSPEVRSLSDHNPLIARLRNR
jgi:endonuclease/exonuclease/phosphatase family metal-dependent hydrolase